MARIADLPRKAPKILLYGPPGSGKTAFALTLGARAQVLDLDDGLMTGMTLEDKWTQVRQSVDAVQFLEKNPAQANAFREFGSHLVKVSDQCRAGKFPFQALVIDSLTAICDFALRQVLAADSNNGGDVNAIPQIQHWQPLYKQVDKVLVTIRSLPIPVIVIAHEQVREIDNKMKMTISTPTQNMPDKITRWFDEWWYASVKPSGGSKYKYVVKTKSTASVGARSRGNVPDDFDMEQGMESIMQKLGYQFKVETAEAAAAQT